METIEIFINKVHGWTSDYELFGPFIARRHDMANESPNTIFSFFLSDKCDVPDVSVTFSRYATLLERLTAMASLDPEQVYSDLCDMLQKTYEDVLCGTNHATSLRDTITQIEKYQKSPKPTTFTSQFCAQVARVLIFAWTYQVNIIEWELHDKRLQLDSYAKNVINPEDTREIIGLKNTIGALGL
jgi:hypothetical protein